MTLLGYEKACINGMCMVYVPPERFDRGGSTCTKGIWIPYDYRDAIVRAAYDAETAWDASPNADWGWVWNQAGGGTIAIANDETTLNAQAVGADQSYLEWTDQAFMTGKYLVYINEKTTWGDHDNAVQSSLTSLVTNKDFLFNFAEDGVVGDIQWNAGGTEYSLGEDDFTELLLIMDINKNDAISYDYQNMIPLATNEISDIAASGNNYYRLGDFNATRRGRIIIKGFPAVVIFEVQ